MKITFTDSQTQVCPINTEFVGLESPREAVDVLLVHDSENNRNNNIIAMSF